MVNFRAFTSLTYLTQIAFLGGNGQINSSELLDLVPRREVLYVGGRYTNVTVSLSWDSLIPEGSRIGLIYFP